MTTGLGAALDGGQVERRRFPRYAIRVPVTVAIGEGATDGVRGHTIDISAGGFRIVTDQDLSHAMEQTVRLECGDEPIVARVEILRSERRGTQWVHGMAISDMSAPNSVRLGQLCRDRS